MTNRGGSPLRLTTGMKPPRKCAAPNTAGKPNCPSWAANTCTSSSWNSNGSPTPRIRVWRRTGRGMSGLPVKTRTCPRLASPSHHPPHLHRPAAELHLPEIHPAGQMFHRKFRFEILQRDRCAKPSQGIVQHKTGRRHSWRTSESEARRCTDSVLRHAATPAFVYADLTHLHLRAQVRSRPHCPR